MAAPAQQLATVADIGAGVAAPASGAGFRRAWAGPWGRLLIPSLSDLFFVAVLVWLFMASPGGWSSLLSDGDTGWHIRAGEYILDHRAVPSTDLFSFSKEGAPWYAWEWLADVLFAICFRAAGLKGVTLFAGVLIALFAAVLLRYTLWRGANALPAALAALLAVGSSTVHFLARPHLFTLLLLPVCIWLVEADRRRPSRAVWLAVPLTAVWANLHGGFLILLACLAILALGTQLEAWLRASTPASTRASARATTAGGGRRYAALLLACASASLLNPYGAGLHRHIFEYLRSGWIRELVQEFQAPTFRSEGQSQFEILLAAGVMLAAWLLAKRRIPEALWILFLAHAGLTSLRHAPLYASVAAPLVASEASAWWRLRCAGMRPASLARILHQLGEDLRPAFRKATPWPAVFVLAVAFAGAPISWPRDFPEQLFPVGMARRNAALLQAGRVFTTDQWADYLIFKGYPAQKVFVDGRSDFFGEALGREYLRLLQGSYDSNAILERYRLDVALLPVEWPLAALLKANPAWSVIEDDHRAILFLRKKPA